MNDLEMTRLCAEAVGLHPCEGWQEQGSQSTCVWCHKEWPDPNDDRDIIPFAPLNDDAQAMALVKKFELEQCRSFIEVDREEGLTWSVQPHHITKYNGMYAENADLNRAIVECVAKMQAAA